MLEEGNGVDFLWEKVDQCWHVRYNKFKEIGYWQKISSSVSRGPGVGEEHLKVPNKSFTEVAEEDLFLIFL